MESKSIKIYVGECKKELIKMLQDSRVIKIEFIFSELKGGAEENEKPL